VNRDCGGERTQSSLGFPSATPAVVEVIEFIALLPWKDWNRAHPKIHRKALCVGHLRRQAAMPVWDVIRHPAPHYLSGDVRRAGPGCYWVLSCPDNAWWVSCPGPRRPFCLPDLCATMTAMRRERYCAAARPIINLGLLNIQ